VFAYRLVAQTCPIFSREADMFESQADKRYEWICGPVSLSEFHAALH